MKTTLAVLILAGATLLSPGARAAALSAGGPGDLIKAVDARAAKLGKVLLGDAPLGQFVSDKGALVRVLFNDIGPVLRGGGQTAFIGHHVVSGSSDFAWVTFPADVEISSRCSAVVVGSFTGVKEVSAANGSKVKLPVLAARVVGVIDGVTFKAGVPTYAPNSPIRVYEKAAKKATKKP